MYVYFLIANLSLYHSFLFAAYLSFVVFGYFNLQLLCVFIQSASGFVLLSLGRATFSVLKPTPFRKKSS